LNLEIVSQMAGYDSELPRVLLNLAVSDHVLGRYDADGRRTLYLYVMEKERLLSISMLKFFIRIYFIYKTMRFLIIKAGFD
jgi:hypothetical protein